MIDAPLGAQAMFLLGFFVELGFVVLAAAIAHFALGVPFPTPLRLTADGALLGLGATVPLGALSLVTMTSLGQRIGPLRRISELLKGILGPGLREWTPAQILLLSGAAGVGEEVLFRGVIHGLVGIHATSIVFGALHALTPTYFVLAAGLSYYLGWLLDSTGNLLVPIVVHAAYDAIGLFLLRKEVMDADLHRGDPGHGSPEDAGS